MNPVGLISIVAASLVLATPLSAAVRMPKIFSDSMVLQRGMPVPIWGWADAGEAVTVTFAAQTKQTIADENGRWRVKLDPLNANTNPCRMTVKGSTAITFEDVVVGEVWICAGQSNMEFPNGSRAPYRPHVRLFHMTPRKGLVEQDDLQEGSWSACAPYAIGSPENVQCFSHIGLVFGEELQKSLGVPVGLIDNSQAGTTAEAWSRFDDLAPMPDYASAIEKLSGQRQSYSNFMKGYIAPRAAKAWQALFPRDASSVGISNGWHLTDCDDSTWASVTFADKYQAGNPASHGTGWFRKRITIPATWENRELVCFMGRMAQAYDLYVNGVKVGSTGDRIYGGWTMPHSATIPAGVVKPGPAVLAVHALGFDWSIGGAQTAIKMGPKGETDPTHIVSLLGAWKFKEEIARTPEQAKALVEQVGTIGSMESRNAPSYLYNTLTLPLAPFAIRGVIWYQGESNVDRAHQYRWLLSTLITGWRKTWGQGDFAFVMVQLPSYDTDSGSICKGPWYALREAQLQVLKLSNTAMAVTIDNGDPKQLHPGNKPEVAHRLALAALGKVYGQDIVYSGPMYDSMKVEDGAIRLSFTHVGGGLMAKAGELRQFHIAGEDKVFSPAKAVIDGNTVVVSNEATKAPVAVRYAWANNPAGCNLYNKDGLPASPFRTDTW